MNWTLTDFLFAGIVLAVVAGSGLLLLRAANGVAYIAAAALGVAAGFLTVWINAAVGIIGSPAADINLAFFGVVALAIIGSVLARLRPRGMGIAMAVAALAHAVTAIYAFGSGAIGQDTALVEVLAVAAVFPALWISSSMLFFMASRKHVAF